MNRRHFLSVISAGAVGSAFLRFAYASDRTDDAANATRKLAIDALARAKERGKPLLVLVVSKDSGVWTRGELFGSWLAHADDALLADLALFEIVCVPMSALDGLPIRELASDAEPLMWFVETNESTPRAIAIDGIVPADLEWRARQRELTVNEKARHVMEAAVRERDGLVSKWLRDVVKIDERLPQLAQQVDAALTDAQREEIAKHRDEPSQLARDLVLRAAAVLRQRANVAAPASAQAITGAIASAADAALKVAPPAGALWARHTGCGNKLDDPVEREKAGLPGSRCGMGSVPEISARFLDFFTNRGK